MFFKYLNLDRQPAVFTPISKVRTPHVPGLDARRSRITFHDEHIAGTHSQTDREIAGTEGGSVTPRRCTVDGPK